MTEGHGAGLVAPERQHAQLGRLSTGFGGSGCARGGIAQMAFFFFGGGGVLGGGCMSGPTGCVRWGL